MQATHEDEAQQKMIALPRSEVKKLKNLGSILGGKNVSANQ